MSLQFHLTRDSTWRPKVNGLSESGRRGVSMLATRRTPAHKACPGRLQSELRPTRWGQRLAPRTNAITITRHGPVLMPRTLPWPQLSAPDFRKCCNSASSIGKKKSAMSLCRIFPVLRVIMRINRASWRTCIVQRLNYFLRTSHKGQDAGRKTGRQYHRSIQSVLFR